MRFVLILLAALLPSAVALAAPVYVQSCSQAAIETAIDNAGAGGTVYFPSCTYDVDGLEATKPDQTWVLERGAVIRRTVATTSPILKVSANLSIRGGILDGLRGINLNPSVGIDVNGYSFDWSEGTLRNVSSWGVAVDNAPMTLRDLQISNVKNACVIWRNTASTTMRGPLVENVYCDRSTENPATITSGGILIHAGAGKWTINPRVLNSEVVLPVSAAYDPVAIEIINAQHARVIGNKTVGGRIGISFGNVSYGIITNNIVQVPVDYAFEMATGSSSVNLQANNATGYAPSRWGAIVSGGSNGVKAIGNAFAGFTGSPPTGGCTDGSNVCWYSGSSYSANYGN